VDGKSTGDAKNAPEIIEKQLVAIRPTEEETKAVERILDRLERAKEFHSSILLQIGN